jgi:dipeptidyl-peptidase-4
MKWMKDGRSWSYLKMDSASKKMCIYRVDAKSGEEEMIVNTASIAVNEGSFRFVDYDWSPDGHSVLFTISQHGVWRRSTVGTYAVYRMETGKLIPVPKHGDGVRTPKISPDGRWVGYVAQDNIWVMDLDSGHEIQLSNDAAEHVFNGRFGWVYEEEFEIADGWMWSPDSKRIAYWQENENSVPEYKMTNWMPLHLDFEALRYPKPGDPNPVMRIGVVSLESSRTVWMDIGRDTDQYIPRIYWTNDPWRLAILRMNRLQNRLDLLFAEATTGESRVIITDTSKTGWIEIADNIRFVEGRNRFLWISERDGWNQVYLYDYDGNLINRVTDGRYDVTEISCVDGARRLYYISTEVSPLERHLFSVDLDGENKVQLTRDGGYHSINMNPAGDYYIDTYSSLRCPTIVRLCNYNGEELRVLAKADPAKFEQYKWMPREITSFRTADGLELYCSIIKPADFDPAKKYPVFMDVYGGPGYQNVVDRWPSAMHEWAANEGFVTVQIDNRGGSARGTDFKHRVYKQLGKWEVSDYVECARFLATLPYIEKDKIGIWGWSYGGYVSALSMLLGDGTFKAGVAIAPVTDWRFYDSIYAERFMQRPQDNEAGYKFGSCVDNASKLKGNLLVIHGGLDDNVHLQNTMKFVDKLEQNGLQFDMRIYPNGNHGVANGMKSTLGLFEYYMKFMKEHLQ